MNLRALQAWFVHAMTHGDDASAGAARASEAYALPTIDALLTHYRARRATDRFAIYHHAYRARLRECLLDDYPVLAHALGADAFDDLCAHYIEAHPSTKFSLNAYGRHLPAWAQGRVPTWCAELARLEWALVEAVHAESHARLRQEQVADLSPAQWEHARLVPNPALAVLRFTHPVNAYFKRIKEHGESEPPAPEASALAVCRREMTVWRVDLSAGGAEAIERLLRGESLLSALTAVNPEPSEVSRWFRTWIECGFWSDVQLT